MIEYSGALVVISHDRHLLRSVCDELLNVHDGIVEPFRLSLDEYPQWLKDQDQGRAAATEDVTEPPAKQLSRKQQRQEQAQRRQRLKPLLDAVRDIEQRLAAGRERLEALDKRAADESLYQDPARSDEVRQLLKEQASVKADIETLEWDWLEASEALEKAG